MPQLIALAGSLRTDSYNKRLARLAGEFARGYGAQVDLLDLRDYPLPLFDEDLEREQGLPAPAIDLKRRFKAGHGFLIASPEYNSSISGVLKNTIDWVSRPMEGERPYEPFAGKVCGLMSASPGRYGGLRGLWIVRLLMTNMKSIVLPDQVAVGLADRAFDSAGNLSDTKLQQALAALVRDVVETASKLHE
jgi:NAD(P)H-dependent FMN reductase